MIDLWSIVAAILIAGAVGGVVNALTTDNGFILPKTVHSGELTVLRIGALGNIGPHRSATRESSERYRSLGFDPLRRAGHLRGRSSMADERD